MAKKKICPYCGKVPICGIVFLVIGVLWLLSSLEVISAKIPWLPIVFLLLVICGMVHHSKLIKK